MNKNIIIGAIVVIAVAVGGYFVAKQQATAEYSLQEVLTASSEINSYSTAGTITIGAEGSLLEMIAEDTGNTELAAAGEADLVTVTVAGDVAIVDDVEQTAMNLIIDASTVVPGMKADLDIVVLSQKEFYVRGNQLPQIGFLSLQPFEDRWIAVNLDDLAEQAAQFLDPADAEALQQELDDQIDPQDLRLIEKQVADVVAASDAIGFASPCGRATVRGVRTDCLNLSIDIEKVVFELLPDIIAVIEENQSVLNLPADVEGMTQQIEDILAEMKETPEVADTISGTRIDTAKIWLGRSDLLPYRSNVSVVIPADVLVNNLNLDAETNSQDAAVTINTDIEMFDYGQSKDIAAPSESTSIDEIMAEVFGSMFAPMDPSLMPTDLDVEAQPIQ
jgi:hypothetical protein